MDNNYILTVRDLKKKFGNFEALKGISFELKKGEILGFLGPNGAGKTTTIQCLLGITTPTSGHISVLGMNYKNNREEILSRINFSSAYIALPEKLTVWENLLVFANLYNVKNISSKINSLLELFQIPYLKNKPVGQLSAGQKTRVSFAKSLLNDPEIMLLDEPMASLDPEVGDRTREFLKKIQQERDLTILYTSHNMDEVERLCNRIIFLNKGIIAAEGSPVEVTKQVLGHENHEPALEEVFIKLAREGKEDEAE